MSDMIKQLMAEYGFLAEDADIERNVKDQITRAQTKDEVDTIAFGLETDDGQIVKVYVNAEHAEKFEQEMAEMLGEVDDIEEALNQISKDIEIVDVEWPEEAEEDGDADDVDENADDDVDAETDGSEVMNSKVYSKENKKKEGVKESSGDIREHHRLLQAEYDGLVTKALSKYNLEPVNEGNMWDMCHALERNIKKLKGSVHEDISYGDELTMRLFEAGANSIANQLSTVNQHLIYQAILHLGVPELALDKSPYRSAILKGIKGTALELAHTPSMRNTLKIFIKQQAMDDKKGPEEEPFRGDAAKEGHGRHKGDEYDKGMKAAGVPIEPKSKKHPEPKAPTPHEDKKSKYEVKESDDDSAASTFWGAVDSILSLMDATEGKELAGRVRDSQGYKSLIARSRTRVVGRMTAGVRTKLAALARALETAGSEEVTEQYTYVDVQDLLSLMFRIADDTKGDLAARVTASQVFKRLMLSGRTAFVSASSTVKRALQQLDNELKKISLTEAEDELSFDAPSDKGADQQEPEKEPAAAEPPAPDATESGVAFEADGDSLKVTYPGGSFELSGESLERAMKALTNKQTLSVQLDGGKFATFSPRGSSAVIKLMGSDTVVKLAPPDISAFTDAGGQVAAGEVENKKGPDVKESLQPSAWEALSKEAEERFGEFGFGTLDEDDMAKLIDLPKANKLALKHFGQSFSTLEDDELKFIIDRHPELKK